MPYETRDYFCTNKKNEYDKRNQKTKNMAHVNGHLRDGATSCKTETKQNESKNYKLSGLIRTRKSQQPILLPSKECRTLTSILK